MRLLIVNLWSDIFYPPEIELGEYIIGRVNHKYTNTITLTEAS